MLTLGMVFWIIFIVATLFRSYQIFRTAPLAWPPIDIVYWVLVLLLGIGTFGSPIRF